MFLDCLYLGCSYKFQRVTDNIYQVNIVKTEADTQKALGMHILKKIDQ